MKIFPWMLLLWFAPLAPAAAQDDVFDLHVHIWNGAESVRAYEAQLRADDQIVTRYGAIHMAVLGRQAETRAKNDELIALAAQNPRVLPIPSVHPYDGEAAFGELRRVAARGVRAIKLHPHTQQFDASDVRVRALCEEAGRLGIVVMIDNASIVPGDNQTLFNLAISVPNTRFIFTHMGGLEFRFWNLLAFLRTTDNFFSNNIYFDISATIVLMADSPLEAEFVWTLRNIGVDHILLGSDYPQMSLADAAGALERLDLTPEERAQIRWGNAQALLLGEAQAAPGRLSRQPLRRPGE